MHPKMKITVILHRVRNDFTFWMGVIIYTLTDYKHVLNILLASLEIIRNSYTQNSFLPIYIILFFVFVYLQLNFIAS